ncbi:MAG: crossover junction endodeoxyribonuclease RuvC [Spirochaetota bacterium]|nr:crossover junction endodeoxyribonuclease RuvC [Spirochaetota bacterium]
MTILGIDPGLATVGYGIIDVNNDKYLVKKVGVIQTSSETRFSKRLHTIYLEMQDLIREFKPDEIAIEELFFSKNTKTAMIVSQARGVLILSCVGKDIPIYEYTPLQIKQGITGSGRADKSQVTKMVTYILGLESSPKPDDAADALAIAVCHANQTQNLKKMNFINREI